MTTTDQRQSKDKTGRNAGQWTQLTLPVSEPTGGLTVVGLVPASETPRSAADDIIKPRATAAAQSQSLQQRESREGRIAVERLCR